MSLQDLCGHLATQCGVVNFVPSYLPPMNGLQSTINSGIF